MRILNQAELEITETDIQWYVPHVRVLNPNEPDKVRRVCNAASKLGEVSLNDKLVAGPNFQESFKGISSKMREKQIALIADVEAM